MDERTHRNIFFLKKKTLRNNTYIEVLFKKTICMIKFIILGKKVI